MLFKFFKYLTFITILFSRFIKLLNPDPMN